MRVTGGTGSGVGQRVVLQLPPRCLDQALAQTQRPTAHWGSQSPVNVAPISDLNHKHTQRVVLHVADDPVVAHAVAPVST